MPRSQTAEKPKRHGRTGRPPKGDRRVAIDGTLLAFAREQAGLTRWEVAKRVSAQLQRRGRFRRGASRLLHSISEVALLHWETGKTRTCGESVLSALSVVLKVPPRFLKGETEFVPVRFSMPGLRVPVELEMNLQGKKQFPHYVSVPGGAAFYEGFLHCFTSLDFWREMLLLGELPKETTGKHLTFLKQAVSFLQTVLEPLDDRAHLSRVAVFDLVQLMVRNSSVGRPNRDEIPR